MKAETESRNTQNTFFSVRVEQVISRYIRPLLRKHGGDIMVREIWGRDICISLLGTCHHCPAAQMTIEQTVRVILSRELEEKIGKILLINETDSELLDLAKQLLKYNKP
ncbi:NifU family protein [Gabonibacter massiliensis]|uniref:NifU family protein n=1 Tax=Gabonibacter massiliensis TaxID=1720195 RepID=UPI00073F0E69|nr:NifU family protein [Gabonibacter massiliensis]